MSNAQPDVAREDQSTPTEGALLVAIVDSDLDKADAVKTCIRAAHGALFASNLLGDVVVADNASQDIARVAGACVVDVPLRGYDLAITAGCGAACGRYRRDRQYQRDTVRAPEDPGRVWPVEIP